MQTHVLVTQKSNPQFKTFKKATYFDNLSTENRIKYLEKRVDLRKSYTSDCRESLLSVATDYILYFNPLLSNHRVFVYFKISVSLSKQDRYFLSYLYKILAERIKFKYKVRSQSVEFIISRYDYSVPLASFLLFFAKYIASIYFPKCTGKMSYRKLIDFIPRLLNSNGFSTRLYISFALWLFLVKSDNYFYTWHDHIYGNSTTGIASAMQKKLYNWNYIVSFKEFIDVYDVSSNLIPIKLGYLLYISKDYSLKQFNEDKMYERI